MTKQTSPRAPRHPTSATRTCGGQAHRGARGHAPPWKPLGLVVDEEHRLFRRLKFAFLIRRQRLGEKRVEQAAASIVGGAKARFQLVAKQHQSINPGDYAALFSEGWERNWNTVHLGLVHFRLRGAGYIRFEVYRVDEQLKIAE